ncbi:MAG: hypothetical protein WBO34_15495 [Gammaproteobacteria bacterium]
MPAVISPHRPQNGEAAKCGFAGMAISNMRALLLRLGMAMSGCRANT